MTQIFDQATAYIEQLVTGAQITHMSESSNSTTTVVTCCVTHPKRKLTPSSFTNKAKKLGMTTYGTRGATGPTLIVAYVNVSDTTELCIKGSNEGHMNVEVRTKK